MEGTCQERMVAGEGFEPPTVAICFYRALVQSGETRPVEALIEALAAEGMRVLPLFVSSLKDAVSVGTLESIFSEAAPDVVHERHRLCRFRARRRPAADRAGVIPARRCCR